MTKREPKGGERVMSKVRVARGTIIWGLFFAALVIGVALALRHGGEVPILLDSLWS